MLSPSVPDDAASALPPNGLQLLGRVAGHAWQQTRAEGLSDGLRVLLGAGRMLGEREMLAELFAIPAFARLMTGQPEADALFFISHRYFLSRGFSAADRLACVLDHYRFEQVHFTHDLLLPLHGDGLCLWQHPAGYEILLRANADTRHEGPLSVALCREAKTLHEISFAWIEAQRLSPGAGRAPVLFATRNQSLPSTSPALARFRTDLPQNSPAYFGLAALNGVACAVGQQRLVGVRDDCQIAYEPCYAEGFRRSYDDFWLGFGGQLLGRHGFEMPVPAAVVPLDGLKAKHRTRARQRREHWREIAKSAQAALGPYVIPRKST